MSLSRKSKTFAEAAREKFLDPSAVVGKVTDLREKGLMIVTINGSFDLLHAGHLEILYRAAQQGDVLIVALNTDRSIRSYKGPERPIIPFDYRRQLLAALEMVDFITWFDALDPRELLARIKPDVHVNGAEYGEECIEAETVKTHGGRLHLVERIDGLSTSRIISTCVSLVS